MKRSLILAAGIIQALVASACTPPLPSDDLWGVLDVGTAQVTLGSAKPYVTANQLASAPGRYKLSFTKPVLWFLAHSQDAAKGGEAHPTLVTSTLDSAGGRVIHLYVDKVQSWPKPNDPLGHTELKPYNATVYFSVRLAP